MTIRICMSLAMLLLALPAWSQESPAPPKYFLMSEFTLQQADSSDWAEALAMAAQAHAKHHSSD